MGSASSNSKGTSWPKSARAAQKDWKKKKENITRFLCLNPLPSKALELLEQTWYIAVDVVKVNDSLPVEPRFRKIFNRRMKLEKVGDEEIDVEFDDSFSVQREAAYKALAKNFFGK
jgi:hypothetical protein